MGDADEHVEFVPVSPAHPLFTSSPFQFGDAKDLQTVRVRLCGLVAKALHISPTLSDRVIIALRNEKTALCPKCAIRSPFYAVPCPTMSDSDLSLPIAKDCT